MSILTVAQCLYTFVAIQDVDSRCLEDKSNNILTSIVHGIKRDEPATQVKLATTNAMLNSLDLTRSNFEKDSERPYIMQVVCEGTQCEDIQVSAPNLPII